MASSRSLFIQGFPIVPCWLTGARPQKHHEKSFPNVDMVPGMSTLCSRGLHYGQVRLSVLSELDQRISKLDFDKVLPISVAGSLTSPFSYDQA